MSRSVSVLSDSEVVAYLESPEWEWDDFVDGIKDRLKEIASSLDEPYRDKWDGREVKIILENKLCEIGIAEYCGLSSVSIRVSEEAAENGYEALAKKWIASISDKFSSIGDLVKIGTFPNGESVYRRA